MYVYLYIILAYLLILMFFNFYRSRKVKSQDDFMVAGRKLSLTVMVFTLICTWIGSGTFIAGAEFAAKAGMSALWLAAGAWFGIIVIYFLAGKIRTFGQYTIGDILEVRYGPAARVCGAIALIISFTAIVSYQFVAGGFILNVVTDGAIPDHVGTLIAAAFVILFTSLAGMVAVAYTDLPNGIIILLACLLSVPFVYLAAGGYAQASQSLNPGYFEVINEQFGAHPTLKAGGYFLATLLLLMGVQSMYQKFYSAKSPKEARQGVVLWVIGTVFVETVVVVIAVFAYSKFQNQIDLSVPKEGGKLVLLAARNLVPGPVGVLLLGAACAVVLSTGMNYLLCVAITPALIAALAWKRATKAGGLASIISGSVVCVFLKVMTYVLPAEQVPEGDPWGIPLIYPSIIISLACLIVVSLLTKPPKDEDLKALFGTGG